MAQDIVRQDINALVEGWLKAEQQGEKFPVDFDLAWPIAGYARKDSAKRYLPKSSAGKLYHVLVEKTEGRPKNRIMLSCDGMKHLCLMADTPEGEAIRDYFIDAEKKWKLVQQTHPDVAQDIEMMHLQIELAKIEAQKEQSIAQAKQADLQLIQFRHIVTTTMPEPIQQKILGYSEINTIEYRDRIIKNEDVVRDGSTINKTALCHRLGILTRNGKPDYRSLNHYLDSLRLPSEAWRLTAVLQENAELDRDYLPMIEQRWINGDRQRWLCE